MVSTNSELTSEENAQVKLLRKDLEAAGFLVSNISSIINAEALNAVKLGVTWPATKILNSVTAQPALKCLINLFVLGNSVSVEEAEATFRNLGLQGAYDLELISADTVGVRARSSITAHESVLNNPGQTLWIISDLEDYMRESPASYDHVMGIGGATISLLSAISNHQVATAADVGTGNGIIALELAGVSESVIASDISERALRFARINAVLNDISSISFVEGSLLDPLANNRFDLIVSNPPFVIAPGEATSTWQYRSGGSGADSLFRQLLTELPGYLKDGGYFIGLGNWEGEIADSIGDQSSWVIARGAQTPLEYVETWLRDGGVIAGTAEHKKLRREWLDDFEQRHVKQVTYGYVMIHNSKNQTKTHRYEDLGTNLGQGIRFGDAWRKDFESGLRVEAMSESSLLESTFKLTENIFELRTMIPGTEGIIAINLMRQSGIERQEQVATVAAAMAGAATGELTVGQTVYGLSELLDVPYDELKTEIIEIVKALVWGGFIEESDAVE